MPSPSSGNGRPVRGSTPRLKLPLLVISGLSLVLSTPNSEVQGQKVQGQKVNPLKKSDIYYNWIPIDNRLIPGDEKNKDLRIFMRSLQGILAKKYFDCLGEEVAIGGSSAEGSYDTDFVPDYCERLRSYDTGFRFTRVSWILRSGRMLTRMLTQILTRQILARILPRTQRSQPKTNKSLAILIIFSISPTPSQRMLPILDKISGSPQSKSNPKIVIGEKSCELSCH
jgi:hypothetical protein